MRKCIIFVILLITQILFSSAHAGHDHDHDHHDHDHDHGHDHGDQEFDQEQAAKQFKEEAEKLIVEMGIDKKETIDRATFKTLFERILTKDTSIPEEEKDIFTNLIQKVGETVPDEFPVKDIPKYLDLHKISEILNELMGDLPQEGGEGEEEPELVSTNNDTTKDDL
jgi:hypothetical protein